MEARGRICLPIEEKRGPAAASRSGASASTRRAAVEDPLRETGTRRGMAGPTRGVPPLAPSAPEPTRADRHRKVLDPRSPGRVEAPPLERADRSPRPTTTGAVEFPNRVLDRATRPDVEAASPAREPTPKSGSTPSRGWQDASTEALDRLGAAGYSPRPLGGSRFVRGDGLRDGQTVSKETG